MAKFWERGSREWGSWSIVASILFVAFLLATTISAALLPIFVRLAGWAGEWSIWASRVMETPNALYLSVATGLVLTTAVLGLGFLSWRWGKFMAKDEVAAVRKKYEELEEFASPPVGWQNLDSNDLMLRIQSIELLEENQQLRAEVSRLRNELERTEKVELNDERA